jgi:hypothetical protein
MRITIERGPVDDMADIIKRSPVSKTPGADLVMKECLFRSIHIYQGRLDGVVACVWGLIPPTLLSNSAYLWLLTTNIVAENKFLFIRYSQRYIEEALKIWPTLNGDIIGDNPAAKKWLGFLGAVFDERIGDRTPFTIRRKALNG